MLNYFNSNKFLFINNRLQKYVFALFIIVIAIGLLEALILSPEDYKQSDSVRIMYVHVPSSFISLGCFAFIGVASILNLILKIKFTPLMAKSLAPVGALFTLVSIVTASLWGKPTW